MTHSDDIKYWAALNLVPQLRPARFRTLEAHFGHLANAWDVGPPDLLAAGIENQAAREIIATRGRVDSTSEMVHLERAGVKALNWDNPQYPPRPKKIHGSPRRCCPSKGIYSRAMKWDWRWRGPEAIPLMTSKRLSP